MLEVVTQTPIERVIEGSGLHLVGRGRYLRAQEHDSLIIDTRANMFNWNSRNLHGDALTWLTEVCHLSFQEARTQLESGRFGATLPLPARRGRSPVREPALPPLAPHLATDLHTHMSATGWAWWRSEGMSDAVIRAFRLGEIQHPTYGHCFSIPIFNATGELENVKLRLVEPAKVQQLGKYRPLVIGRGTYLFNRAILTQAPPGVIVVAGEKKVMVLAGYHIEAVSPTGGCGNWLPEWTDWLQTVPRRWVAYDPAETEAGRKVALRIGARLACFADKPDDFILAHGKRAFVRVLREAIAP